MTGLRKLVALSCALFLLAPQTALAHQPAPVFLSGQTTTRLLPIQGGLHTVHVSGFANVRITQGPNVSLRVTTDPQYLPRVRAEVRHGVLELGNVYAEDGLRPPLTFELEVPDLRNIRASGGAGVELGAWVAQRLKIEVNGAGRVEAFALSAEAIRVAGSGGGHVAVEGPYRVERESVRLSGNARFERPRLPH
ncbi:MAG: DUF2807 domain-containing protein [Planctomycetota bacterium]